MAGRGFAPKHPAQRRNHHPPQRGDWVDLPPLEKAVLPVLPKRQRGECWSARTRLVWDAWRQDPVTVMWSPADIAYALETIVLVEAMTPSSASEVRLRMDGLGLTPKGKRDLRWRIGEPAEDLQSHPAASSPSKRRSRLSVVK